MSMDERARREWQGWLEAEREGRDAEADARFAAVFASRVPRLRPSSGLADRVMFRLVAQARHPMDWRRPAWWGRAALVAAVVGVGAAGAIFLSVFDLVRLASGVLPTLRALGAAGSSWLAAASQAAAVTGSVGRACALAATSGPGVALIAVNSVLVLSASLALKYLLASEEESPCSATR